MKTPETVKSPKTFAKLARIGATCVIAILALQVSTVGAPLPVNLGSAADFAILAGSGITITGPTTIAGDIGSFPTPAVTGFENVTSFLGNDHGADSIAEAAKIALTAAYVDAAGRTPTTSYVSPFDLGGQTLGAGVYNDLFSFGLTGTLTLDGLGDPNAVWIFQMGSTLTTGTDSVVNLINGAQASNVFWQVGSSATLGTRTDFAGSILAMDSITLNTDADIDGSLYARNGAVTLDSNSIVAVPEPGGALLVIAGLTALVAFKRRSFL